MAGQPEQMQQLMQRNPGFQSRIPSKQVFAQRYAPHIGGIDVSSAVSSAPSTVTVHASPSEAVASKAKALLERFEGCEDFKSKMQQLERSAAELRKMGHPVDGLLSNWLFVGEPGTGMVAPSASLRVLAGVTWPSHVFTCFLLQFSIHSCFLTARVEK